MKFADLLHAHGSPTNYLYHRGCRCSCCRGAMSAFQSAYYTAHRADRIRASARYTAAHREQKRERDAIFGRTYREAHKEQRAAYAVAHAEDIAAYHAAYRRLHPEDPEKAAARVRSRRARKYNAHGSHTAADTARQYQRQRGFCYWCAKPVGKHYHEDHVFPLVRGGSDGPENIVVSCPACNVHKNARMPHEFSDRLC